MFSQQTDCNLPIKSQVIHFLSFIGPFTINWYWLIIGRRLWATNLWHNSVKCQSYSIATDRVVSKVVTQSFPNDWPTSMFYQCPPNPNPLQCNDCNWQIVSQVATPLQRLQLTDMCRRLLLSLFPMNGQHQWIVNWSMKERKLMTWELIGKLYIVCWESIGGWGNVE